MTHQPKHFYLVTTLTAMAAHPNFEFTKENYLKYVGCEFKMNWNLSFWVNLKKINANFKYEGSKMGAP